MQSPNNKRIVIAVILGTVLFVILGFIIQQATQNSSKQPKITQYTDPDSGQTVTDIEGKSPEKFGSDADKPILLGFTALLDRGISKYQLNAVEDSFIAYAKQHKIKEISVRVSSIRVLPKEQGSLKATTEFEVKFDRKSVYYKTVVDAIGLGQAQTRLYDGGGKLLFDSGIIDATNTINQGHD